MPAPIPTRADHLRPGDVILSDRYAPLDVTRVELCASGDVRLSLRRPGAGPDAAPSVVTRKPDAEQRRMA